MIIVNRITPNIFVKLASYLSHAAQTGTKINNSVKGNKMFIRLLGWEIYIGVNNCSLPIGWKPEVTKHETGYEVRIKNYHVCLGGSFDLSAKVKLSIER